MIHGQAPICLQELIISKRKEERYNLRSCAMGIMLQTPRTLTKTTLGDRAFLAAAPKLWNDDLLSCNAHLIIFTCILRNITIKLLLLLLLLLLLREREKSKGGKRGTPTVAVFYAHISSRRPVTI